MSGGTTIGAAGIAFEITLPNSWINKADSASDKGGLIGIFFMAFTLALVSFSCTGPIVGTLLVDLTGEKNICISGGYGLNCVANYKYWERFPDLNIYCEPISHDGGTSVGTIDRIKKVVSIIERYIKKKYKLIVVSSAMSGVTNDLIRK